MSENKEMKPIKVKALKQGHYGNSIVEAGHVFLLVAKEGYKQIHTKNDKGEIISTKQEKVMISPKEQLGSWMKQVSDSEKSTIQLEKVGKDVNIAAKGKKHTKEARVVLKDGAVTNRGNQSEDEDEFSDEVEENGLISDVGGSGSQASDEDVI
jgi:hypothetical protein